VVDAGPVGATIARTFPPNTRFFTSPERLAIRGWELPLTTGEKATGEEYLAYLRSFIKAFGLDVRTFQRVSAIDGKSGDFDVTLTDPHGHADHVRCAVIVLATGGTDNPRRLGVPGEDLPHVHSWLGDPHRFFGRRVLVVGGRNSAAESALRLYRIGADVHMVHRQPHLHPRVKHWIRPEVESLLDEGKIVRHMPSEIVSIAPGHVTVTAPGEIPAVSAHSGPEQTLTTETETIEIDDVLLQLGFEQDPRIFGIAGIQTEGPQDSPSVDPATMESNVPGIYVVGTATAGTQDGFAVFIENSHQHADRVAAALAGRAAPEPTAPRPLPET